MKTAKFTKKSKLNPWGLKSVARYWSEFYRNSNDHQNACTRNIKNFSRSFSYQLHWLGSTWRNIPHYEIFFMKLVLEQTKKKTSFISYHLQYKEKHDHPMLDENIKIQKQFILLQEPRRKRIKYTYIFCVLK